MAVAVAVDVSEEDSGAGLVEAVLDRFFDPGAGAKKPAPRAGSDVKSKRYFADSSIAARAHELWSRGPRRAGEVLLGT